MVEWLEVTLRLQPGGGATVDLAHVLARLIIVANDPVSHWDGPSGPQIRLMAVSRESFVGVDVSSDAGARSEAFADAVHDGLLNAAAWLTRQPVEAFDELRGGGGSSDVFIGGSVTQDQFDLDLPAEFLTACGRLSLPICICTND